MLAILRKQMTPSTVEHVLVENGSLVVAPRTLERAANLFLGLYYGLVIFRISCSEFLVYKLQVKQYLPAVQTSWLYRKSLCGNTIGASLERPREPTA